MTTQRDRNLIMKVKGRALGNVAASKFCHQLTVQNKIIYSFHALNPP